MLATKVRKTKAMDLADMKIDFFMQIAMARPVQPITAETAPRTNPVCELAPNTDAEINPTKKPRHKKAIK